MSIIDNTLAAQVPTFDPATPLAQAAKIQAANQEIQQAQFKQNQLELGSEMRGVQPFVNTPDFPNKWREAADRLRAKGVINDQMYNQWANSPSPLLLKSIISQTESPELAFRRGEAARAQGNSNREFGLSQRRVSIAERAANETLSDKVDERSAALSKVGIDPNSHQGKSFLLTGKVADAEASLADTVNQRKAAAVSNGLDPASPGYQSYILTGKMPREDSQPLTSTDKKAIMEAEDDNAVLKGTLDTLKRAQELNKKTFTGATSGYRGWIGTAVPGANLLLDKEAAEATREFGQLMSGEAIKSMSQTLKGATTDREMGRFLEMLADPSTPPEIRGRTIDRMLQLAERQQKINDARINDLRGGSYYKPQNRPDADALRRQAKEAIDAGAPRDEVIKRLKQQGINADGL